MSLPPFRLATFDDVPAIEELIAVSARGLCGASAGGQAEECAAVGDDGKAWLSAGLNSGPQEGPRLARVAEVWTQVNRAMREAEAYNLDRKPLVFSVFEQLAGAARA